MFAEKLNALSKLNVIEAKEGDLMQKGVVLIAPGGRHLTLRRNTDESVGVHLDLQPSRVFTVPPSMFCSHPPRKSSELAHWES
jgi:chemotaxis response regulator CheB